MGRFVHLLVRLIGGLAAILVVVLALAAARLSAGPMSLQFLAPTLASALDGLTPYSFQIGDVALLWRDWQRGLLIHLSDVQAAADVDAVPIAQVETVAVAFSAQAMARGVIAASSIEARNAEIAFRPTDWPPATAAPGSSNNLQSLDDLLGGLRGAPDVSQPLSFLQDVQVRNVTLKIAEPSNAAGFRLFVEQASLTRDDAQRLGGQAALTFSQGAEEVGNVSIILAPSVEADDLSARATFSGLRPAAFAGATPALAPLAAADVALGGSASIDVGPDRRVRKSTLELKGSAGALVLSETLTRAANVPNAAQRLPVRDFALRASFAAHPGEIVVESLKVAFAPGTTLYIPGPVDHRFPLSRIEGTGSYVAGRLSLPEASIDLDGLRTVVSAHVDNLAARPSGTLTVTGTRVRVDDFRRYWPAKAAPGAYRWCIEHLHDGIVPEVRARLDFAARNDTVEVTALSANFDVQRLTVDYLPPMPPVRDTTGRATADLRSLRITVTGGQAAGLSVRGGTILFPDLDRDVPNIDIDLDVAGPVRAAMGLIAHPPLKYAQKIGIDPQQTSGETSTRVRLRFPLLANLDTENINVSAAVDLMDFGLTDIAKGIDISRGQAHLDINNDGLQADGTLAIAGVDGAITWQESFLAQADPQMRIEFTAADVPIARFRQGLREVFAFDEYLLDGSFAGNVGFVLGNDGNGEVRATLDVAHSVLAIPQIGWHKPSGAAGTMDLNVRTREARLTAIPHVAFVAPGLDASGSLRLRDDGTLEHVEIERLIAGRSNAHGTLALLPDGSWDIVVGGISLDLAPLIENGSKDEQQSGSRFAGWPNLTLAADLETLWMSETEPVTNVQATVVNTHGLWSLVQMQGRLTDGSSMEMTIAPANGNARAINATAENAGQVLRAFNVFSDMIGGRLEMHGRFDDSDRTHPLTGRLLVHDYHIIKAPILARLLSVLALTGIRDALTGRGIHFSRLDAPFHVREGVIAITNGRAYGSALGLTASGEVDTSNDSLDVRGELVPFYAVNSALGRLPLLGDVMTGGEKGGGVFSASYGVSGALNDPDVSVNPVTVLFPGFLRWALETFEGWIGIGASPDPTPNPP